MEYLLNSETGRFLYGVDQKVRKILHERVDKYVGAKATPEARNEKKNIIKNFVIACANDITNDISKALESEFMAYDEKKRTLDNMLASKEAYMAEINALKEEAEELRKERDELNQKYSDPKARDAMTIYREVSAPQKGDTSYERQRRITSAGLMASAFLGLTSYNIANANGNSKKTNTETEPNDDEETKGTKRKRPEYF